jgi:flavin-dependent dehydrogenase
LFIDHAVLEVPVAPAAASVARYDLDQNLWSAALQAGVDARQQQTVLSVSGDGPFRVTTHHGVFESRAVINAAGRWSNLSKRKAANGHAPKWLGLKAHFAEHAPPPSVDLYFFQGGYCGVQPVNDSQEVNVCSMLRSDLAASLSEVFELHPALSQRSQSWKQTTGLVSTSPLVFTDPEASDENNVLLAGDAAGFIDPFVGDGISLALRTGKMAAECLQAFFEDRVPLSDAAANYRRQYDRRLLSIFRTSSAVRRLFALPHPARAALLFLFERAPALTRYLVRKTR